MNTLILLAILGVGAMSPDRPAVPVAITSHPIETGLAAVYSSKLDGHIMANGRPYDPARLTAAHESLPFGTRVQVTNARNGKQVQVTITDRGPRQAGRILDLSSRAARALGIRPDSIGQVRFEVLDESK